MSIGDSKTRAPGSLFVVIRPWLEYANSDNDRHAEWGLASALILRAARRRLVQ